MAIEYKYPTWAVLARADIAMVRRALQPLQSRFDIANFLYQEQSEWTAVFCLEPGDPSDRGAADLLCKHKLFPVYRFDFNRYEWCSELWNGSTWISSGDPASVLAQYKFSLPGWEKTTCPDPSRALIVRDASVLEGVTEPEVRAIMEGQQAVTISGPLGAVVLDASLDTRFRLWEKAPARVFEVMYYPVSGKFRLR
jgi:hypothetical protein